MKTGALRWFGHVMRMGEHDFVQGVYEGRSEGVCVRGRPAVRWINRVSESWRES